MPRKSTSTRRPVVLPPHVTPREYQHVACTSAIQFAREQPDVWHLFKAPTGTGKSLIALMIMQEEPDAILCTPRVEIIAGFLQKLGYDTDDLSSAKFLSLADSYGMFTPIRLRNLLAKGELPFLPSLLIVDECHHDLADSYQDITMYLNGIPKVGLTATPYRGTPRDTAAFLAQWGDTVHEVLSLPEAVENNYISFPVASMWPLVDDDIIEVVNGEIKASSADRVISDRIDATVERVRAANYYCRRSKLWDRPTMFAVPTTNLANKLTATLTYQGFPAAAITQATPRNRRNAIFDSVNACQKALVQIDVVSEGVDQPFRRLIDLFPTMSPRRWVQRIGRIMRPVGDEETSPEYVCCCRNLERHGYLMEGLLPSTIIKEAQEVFGKVSKRAGMRGLGLEGLGQFTTIPIETISGLTCTSYNLIHMEQFKRTEYFALVHPMYVDPVFGKRESKVVDGQIRWANWQLIDRLPDTKGFHTAKAYPLTDKQKQRWNEWAEPLGLNPHKEVNNRNVQVLFFLRDIRMRLS